MNEFAHTNNSETWGQVSGAIFFDTRRAKKDDLYPVKIRLTYRRERKYINTGFALTIEDWRRLEANKDKELLKKRNLIKAQYKIIGDHITDMVEKNKFSFDLLDKRLGRGDKNNAIDAFEAQISLLRGRGQVGTAITYSCAMNSLIKYNGNSNVLPFSRITKTWLEGYEKSMIKDGNRYTTISMYLRSLRAIFNISEINSPFDKFEIPKGEGRKMALNKKQINGILMKHPVVSGSTTDKMRDLWYFSFLTNGLNVKDMISLKWENIDLINNEITFIRAKTIKTKPDKKNIKAPILQQMQMIIDKWGCKDSKYIFGYMQDNLTPDEIRIVCQNVTRLMNKHLKNIAKEAGLPHISTYSARHSYASVMLRGGASTAFISEQLGHSNIATTQAYLDGFDFDTRREMNETLTSE
jgi:integrase